MQFYADIVKSMNIKGYLTVDDLYNLSEAQIIEKIKNCDDEYLKDSFNKFQNATVDSIYGSDTPVKNKYCIRVKSKKRYIIPLTEYNGKVCRINTISEQTQNDIDEYFNMKLYKYTGFDFDFKPY